MPTFVVPDTKEGWADALVLGMKTWFDGNDIEFDFSELRPAGARLKTMGGKSSGPQPLINLLGFHQRKNIKETRKTSKEYRCS
jgi:ribonucleotide reductase alpha subunit